MLCPRCFCIPFPCLCSLHKRTASCAHIHHVTYLPARFYSALILFVGRKGWAGKYGYIGSILPQIAAKLSSQKEGSEPTSGAQFWCLQPLLSVSNFAIRKKESSPQYGHRHAPYRYLWHTWYLLVTTAPNLTWEVTTAQSDSSSNFQYHLLPPGR